MPFLLYMYWSLFNVLILVLGLESPEFPFEDIRRPHILGKWRLQLLYLEYRQTFLFPSPSPPQGSLNAAQRLFFWGPLSLVDRRRLQIVSTMVTLLMMLVFTISSSFGKFCQQPFRDSALIG